MTANVILDDLDRDRGRLILAKTRLSGAPPMGWFEPEVAK